MTTPPRFLILVLFGFGLVGLNGMTAAQNFPGEPIAGYFQSVQIRCSDGVKVSAAAGNQFSVPQSSPFQAGFLAACRYRLKLTEIPFHAGAEIFPTLTLFARTYPPQGREQEFPIVVEITLEDMELALQGRYVTKIVYLEDPKKALPVRDVDNRQLSADVQGDPIAVAASQGLPVAALQLGSRLPDMNRIDAAFTFGSPPVQWTNNRGQGIMPPQGILYDAGAANIPVSVIHSRLTNDTAAHFETADGRTLTEVSNRIAIYAPRFRAVRKTEGLLNESQVTGLVAAHSNKSASSSRNAEKTGFTEQELRSSYARSRDQLAGAAGHDRSGGVERMIGLVGYNNFDVVDSDSMVLRQRTFDFRNNEKTALDSAAAKARGWSGIEGIKVQINELAPMAAAGIEGAASFFQIEDKTSKTSKLRLIKAASKETAKIGETVDFTLRFDNIGNQVIGKVVLLDNLTGRLEFIAGSAKCSLESDMRLEPNAGGSFTIRFEITEPMQPGSFGVIQFQCIVR
ncbi:MAG: hypothetical protein LBT46_02335 [Planctomycetaceae bacterium]|jgi:uncharacterized repeat protein (TIGR01451 family)|nr:hypothetical protein [Planctomycetaceae bacterium]